MERVGERKGKKEEGRGRGRRGETPGVSRVA